MEIKILLFVVLVVTLLYWFRNELKYVNLKYILIWLYALIWWVFLWSLILYLLNYFSINNATIYWAITWPFVEELGKFVVIYFILHMLQPEIKDSQYKHIIWLAIWICVGLWFGIYENVIYYNQWITDIYVMLIRSVLVWWVMLHPLTAGLYGYFLEIVKSNNLQDLFPKVFKHKIWFTNVSHIFDLFWFVYRETNKSFLVIFDTIKNILVLDITIKYILWNEKNSEYGHGPVEIIFEWFFLGVWIHILYNTILTYNTDSMIPYTGNWTILLLQIVGVLLVVLLKDLILSLYSSKIVGYSIVFILILWFVVTGNLSQKLWFLSLIILIVSLLLLSWKINRKLGEV